MRGKNLVYPAISAVVLALDLFTKWAVERKLPLHESVSIIPGLFSLTHVQNRGAAFGLFDDHQGEWKTVLLIAFTIVALGIVVYLLWKTARESSATPFALSLVLGGALGNLHDRIIAGHVTDFLLVYYRTYHWPAFNVADCAIVVGAIMLMAEILFAKTPAKTQA